MSAAGLSIFASFFLFLSFDIPLSAGQELFRVDAETNVNQRYTVESIFVGGVQVERAKLPAPLRHRLVSMVGGHCDMAAISQLASDLKNELHFRQVTEHLSKGSQPNQIRVDFEVVKREVGFEIAVPKFLLHSKQGGTGEIDASVSIRENTLTVGSVSNNDDLTEHFTGIVTRYSNAHVLTDKLHFGIGFEDFHEVWSGATRNALALYSTRAAGNELYRSRRNIAPEITFSPVKSLNVSAGVSFEQMLPENPASGISSANAVTAGVHYAHQFEGEATQQMIDGKYSLRVGMSGLGSDYSYTRHVVSFRYEIRMGRQLAFDEFGAGVISGDAPLFERFVLGTSSTLRGWDKSSLDPLGGDRVIHNSITYGYQLGEGTLEAFYDSGALWNASRSDLGRSTGVRHSLGATWRQGVFTLTMALPVVAGRVSTVLIAGMNY